jgi:alpha-acetolactate decarboxylase
MHGWCLHFVTDGRTAGTHLLDCRAVGLRVQLQELADARIAFPEAGEY